MSEQDNPDNRRLVKIEDSIDKEVNRSVMVAGAAKFENMLQVMEFAKLISTAQTAIPKHLRGNPGMCLAVTMQAMDWGMSPIALANKSYSVNDRVAYESQAIHAAVEMSGKLIGRLKHRYVGDGPTRQCIVSGHIKGEPEPVELTSPKLADIKIKNSPLWQSKPDVQLFYNTSRDWARIHLPEVLLGAYTPDELDDGEQARAERARDVTGSGLAARLTGNTTGEGYKPENTDALRSETVATATGGADELANVAADVPSGMAQPTAANLKPDENPNTGEPAAGGKPQEAVDPAAGTKQKRVTAKPTEKPEPKTAEEYIAHLTAWAAKSKDDAYIMDRYAEEKSLRTKCGVMGDDMTMCARIKNDRLAELGSA